MVSELKTKERMRFAIDRILSFVLNSRPLMITVKSTRMSKNIDIKNRWSTSSKIVSAAYYWFVQICILNYTVFIVQCSVRWIDRIILWNSVDFCLCNMGLCLYYISYIMNFSWSSFIHSFFQLWSGPVTVNQFRSTPDGAVLFGPKQQTKMTRHDAKMNFQMKTSIMILKNLFIFNLYYINYIESWNINK